MIRFCGHEHDRYYKTSKANDLYELKTSFAAMSFPRPAGWANNKTLSKDLKRQQIYISKHSNLTTLPK